MPAAAQPYHHGNLRATLLDLAATTIETGGVDALSLRQLARDAGVSHAAPSRHFRDRQALLDALADEGFRLLTAALEAGYASAPDAARARFDALGRAYLRFALAHPALLTLMFGLKHATDARPELVAAGHAALAIELRVVTAAQAAGEIADGDPRRIALAAFAAVHGIATLAVGGLLDGVPAEELLGVALDVHWRGLQPVR